MPTALPTMRGASVAACGGPENMKICNDLPIPVITEPHQVLIDVRAAGVNPVDTVILAGKFDLHKPLPYVPGIDGAGVVREIGSAVTHLQVGDRVWFYTHDGAVGEVAMATYAFPLAKGLSFTEGACLGLPYSVAFRAIFTKGHVKPGDRVLIHGASGGVGLASCHLSAFAGASLVVGTAGSQKGLEVVRRNGAHHVVNHREEGYLEKLKEIAPEGFDLIIELAGAVNLTADINLLAKGGRVAIIGGKGAVQIQLGALKNKEISVYGVVMHGATREDHFECAKTLERMFTETNYRPVINKIYPLEETAQAHTDLRDPSLPNAGNRVIIIRK